jgi:hypothetical protein
VLFFGAGFPTGVGEHFYGIHPPAAVVTWATLNAATVHAVVPLNLAGDWLFLAFAFALVTLSGGRSFAAVMTYVGLAVADAVFAVITGMQYAVPQLAALGDGGVAAQAAVVMQTSLEFSLRPIPFGIGLAALGFVLVRGGVLPAAFGVVAIVLALLFAVSFPLRAVIPAFDPAETAATLGVLLWTLISGVALLLPRRSSGAQPVSRGS